MSIRPFFLTYARRRTGDVTHLHETDRPLRRALRNAQERGLGFGQFLVGGLADAFGPRIGYGVIGIATAAVAMIAWRGLRST